MIVVSFVFRLLWDTMRRSQLQYRHINSEKNDARQEMTPSPGEQQWKCKPQNWKMMFATKAKWSKYKELQTYEGQYKYSKTF